MRSNYKFHAIAIAIICVIVTTISVLMAPPPTPAPVNTADVSGRAIEIYSATYGEECNPYIQEALASRGPAKTDENGIIIPQPQLALVTENNVLAPVSALCSGKVSCEFQVTDDTMGINPFPSCAKKLNIAYRCYSFDRLWTLTTNQASTVKIDCNDTATPARK